MNGITLFWLGGLVATVLNLAIEWQRMGPRADYRYRLRLYPGRMIAATVVLVMAWPVLLTAVLANERERNSSH